MTTQRVLGHGHPRGVARNTLAMTVAQIARAVLQLIYFVLIARTLGAVGYGGFVGATALVAIVSPFVSLGSGNLMIREVARDPLSFPASWRAALRTTIVSFTALSLVILPATLLLSLLPISGSTLAMILIADLLFARLLDLAGQAYQAFEKLHRTGQFLVASVGMRAVSAAGLALIGGATTVEEWAAFYMLSTGITAAGALFLVRRELRPASKGPSQWRATTREGLPFAVGLSAQSIYNDIDKVMLASMVGPAAAGTYSAAYRIVETAFSPFRALLYSSYAGFFRAGAGGVRSAVKLAIKLAPFAVGGAFLLSVLLTLSASLLPLLVGDDFKPSVSLLRILSPLLVIRSIQYLAADVLTGSGSQLPRSVCQVGAAVLNIVLNVLLIPLHSSKGAGWATLTTDTVLLVSLAAIAWRKARVS